MQKRSARRVPVYAPIFVLTARLTIEPMASAGLVPSGLWADRNRFSDLAGDVPSDRFVPTDPERETARRDAAGGTVHCAATH